MKRHFRISQLTAALLCAGIAVAQKLEKPPAFEVVSIRPHTAASGPVQRPTMTPNGFYSIGLSLFAIFQTSYVPPNQSGVLRSDLIEGAPDWLRGETWDVVAKVGETDLANWQNPEMRQTMLRAMLQTMLAERCKVVVHHESKEAPVYDLVVAKGGPKFKQAETVDADELRQKLDGGGMIGTNVRVVPGTDGIRYYSISMAILTQTILPGMAGRPVVDKTGLVGNYDLILPDVKRPLLAAPPGPSGEAQLPNMPPPPPETDESIFSVLPEALGLKLELAKGQVDYLVIDHVEHPSDN
jgi:uncharacterized protein (TIGR03435 family)